MKMKRFGIPCPDVVILKKHVLIMSLIGDESGPGNYYLHKVYFETNDLIILLSFSSKVKRS